MRPRVCGFALWLALGLAMDGHTQVVPLPPYEPPPGKDPEIVPIPPHVPAPEVRDNALAESAYFERLSDSLDDRGRRAVLAWAEELARDPNWYRVVIEGHAFGEGSREEARALSKRRAEAVRRALASFGIEEKRIEVAAFGDERPAIEHTDEPEAEWNRRCEIAIRRSQ